MRDYFEYLSVIIVLAFLSRLPHSMRVRIAGWLFNRALAPFLGWRERIHANLDMAMPKLTGAEKNALAHRVCDHLGRLFIELFSPNDMRKIAAETPVEGPGVDAMDAAFQNGRPVICVSGHFGNYDVFRSALVQRGFDVGCLYRLMNNRLFNARYERSIASVGGRIFPRGRAGFTEMIRHLRDGGLLALLIDQHMDNGERLTFLGQPAYTSVSAAQLALKYKALLVPIYAIRQPDGLSFRIIVEAPLPETDETTMTQGLNDSLEARIYDNPEQWLWTHRRWKDR